MVNETFFKLNFRIDSISDGGPVFHLGKKETYQPLISDVSNVELTDTVKILGKVKILSVPHHMTSSKWELHDTNADPENPLKPVMYTSLT